MQISRRSSLTQRYRFHLNFCIKNGEFCIFIWCAINANIKEALVWVDAALASVLQATVSNNDGECCIENTRNFALKARNCVSKTRNFVFKMMNFAG